MFLIKFSVVSKKKRKTKSSGKKKNKKEKKGLQLHSETKKGILVISFITLAVLSILSFFGAAGVFGEYFLKISRWLFGRGFFLITVTFILASVAILAPRLKVKEKKKPVYITIIIGVFLFLISFLGLFHTFASWGGVNGELINNPKIGGGYLGLLIGYPLVHYLGFWAAIVLLLSLLVISILITFNIPLKIPFLKNEESEEEKDVNKDQGMLTKETKKSFFDKFKFGKKKDKIDASDTKIKIGGEDANNLETGKEDDNHKKEEDKTENYNAGKNGNENKESAFFAKSNSFKREMNGFKLPPLDLLEKDKGKPTTGDIKADMNIIRRTLENFGIEVEMAEVNVGPTVTQYTLRPAQGIRLSRITALQKDMSLALAAHPLRIEAPIPGRSLVGIEIPNRSVVIVRLRNLLEREEFQKSAFKLTLALGRDAAGNPVYSDLTKMPHLLVAGATGTGKTIGLNNIITTLLYRNFPEDLKLILIDPKRVELNVYDSIPHLLSPVITNPEKAIGALRWAVSEMEQRFETLKNAGNRDIESYNNNQKNKEERMSYIVIVVDELADLMSSYGREVEANIVRLAQMARAVGIHLIVSTQRPSVEVITGLIKANITSRIAFQVASQIDSRTILDLGGAEKLLGNGDMLFISGNSAYPRRIQGAFLNEQEIKKVTDYLKGMKTAEYEEEVTSASLNKQDSGFSASFNNNDSAGDEFYEDAKQIVLETKKASASLLQRRLRVGYARAARLIDELEERGVVGPADGARPRDVYMDEPSDSDSNSNNEQAQ